jgi:hypothetical protein
VLQRFRLAKDIAQSESLCSNTKQTINEFGLRPTVTSSHSLNLTFPDHIHSFIAFDGAVGCVEGRETQTRIDWLFDEAMILFHDVIEIFTLLEIATVR